MARGAFCNVCGELTEGRYHILRPLSSQPHGELVMCQRCATQAQTRCGICGDMLDNVGYKMHDGRCICAHCHATAVYDVEQARHLYDQVVQVVSGELHMRLNICPALQVVDHNQMQILAQQAKTDDTEYPDSVLGLFFRKGHKRAVYVEYALPRILTTKVLAHEYAHAWQGENAPLLRNPLVREGFAEWVAYRTLSALGAVKKAALMEQQTGLYGQGLRLMLEMQRRAGAEAVLQMCRDSDVRRDSCGDQPPKHSGAGRAKRKMTSIQFEMARSGESTNGS